MNVYTYVFILDDVLIYVGTYQVQTDIFVKTIQTSIWAAGSTSKGRAQGEWEGDLQKYYT